MEEELSSLRLGDQQVTRADGPVKAGPDEPTGVAHQKALTLSVVMGRPLSALAPPRARGDPNGQGLPRWPAFSDAKPVVMSLGPTARTGPVPSADSLKVLDQYFAWRRTAAGAR